jgi:hypothetical protein
VAAVALAAVMAAPEVTSNDMMHPVAPAAGQVIGAVVLPEACTLMKIQSLAPPVAFALKTSVTGEQATVAVVPTVGPVFTAPKTEFVMVI